MSEVFDYVDNRMLEAKANMNKGINVGNDHLRDMWMQVYNELGEVKRRLL